MIKMTTARHIALVLLLFTLCFQIHAQDINSAICAPIIEQALQAVGENCTQTPRNQICYGSSGVHALPHEGFKLTEFQQSSDLLPVTSVQQLQLSASEESWGTAVLQLQMDHPDDSNHQVTMLAMGDVTIESDYSGFAIPVITTSNARIRSTPTSHDGDINIINVAPEGTTIQAIGRDEWGEWLRVKFLHPEDGPVIGWTSRQVLSNTADRMLLDHVDWTASNYTPMQSIRLKTGEASASCGDIPQNGVFIQTPSDTVVSNFFINGVQIGLSSTAFVQTTDQALQIAIIEGNAYIWAEETLQAVPAGTQVSIPLTEDGNAPSSPPSQPIPYDGTWIQDLPFNQAGSDLLHRPLVNIPVVTEETIDDAISQAQQMMLMLSGNYRITVNQILTVEDTLSTQQGVAGCHTTAIGTTAIRSTDPNSPDWGPPLEASNMFGSTEADHSQVLGPNTTSVYNAYATTYTWISPSQFKMKVSYRNHWVGGGTQEQYYLACIQHWDGVWISD